MVQGRLVVLLSPLWTMLAMVIVTIAAPGNRILSEGGSFRMWKQSNQYACSCFSLQRTYTVQDDLVASLEKVNFGVSVLVIPLKEGDWDISKWLEDTRLHQLVYVPRSASRNAQIHELALTAVVRAGPLMSYDKQERLLDYLSNGNYFQLKMELDQSNDAEAKEHITKQIHDLREKYGFSGDISQRKVPNALRHLVVIRDAKAYSKTVNKQKAWLANCGTLCHNVAAQDPVAVKMDLHYEFGVLKPASDPPDVGHTISPEPIHMADTDMVIPFDEGDPVSSEDYEAWKQFFRNHYGPVFRALLSSTPTEQQGIPTIELLQAQFNALRGRRTTWQTLLMKEGILRRLSEIDFPDRTRNYVRDFHRTKKLGPQHTSVHPILRAGAPLRLTSLPVIPVVLGTPYTESLQPEESLRRHLTAEPNPVAHWPKNLPDILTYRASPVFNFVARLENVPQRGFRVASLYTGNPSGSNPGKTEFLHLYLTVPEVQSLEKTLTELILTIWGKHITRHYQQQMFGPGLPNTAWSRPVPRHVSQHRPRSRRQKTTSRSERSGAENTFSYSGSETSSRQSSSSETTASSRGNCWSKETASRGSSSSDVSDSDVSGSDVSDSDVSGSDVSDSDVSASVSSRSAHSRAPRSLLQHKQTYPAPSSFSSSTTDDQEIHVITVEYIGALHLGCWHTSDGQGRLTTNNSLAFIVRPTVAHIRRRDGMAMSYPLSTPPVVVDTFRGSRGALKRLSSDSGVHTSFIKSLRAENPSLYGLLYKKLFAHFKAEESSGLFERNTCSITDLYNSEVKVNHQLVEVFRLFTSFPKQQALKLKADGEQLGTLLAKCYGRVLPSAIVYKMDPTTQTGTAQLNCVEIPQKQHYALREQSLHHL